jgi:hypothetical protein
METVIGDYICHEIVQHPALQSLPSEASHLDGTVKQGATHG